MNTDLFFNRTPQTPLPLFCTEHLATLMAVILIVSALVLFAGKLRIPTRDRTARFSILAILLAEQIARLTYRIFSNPQFNPAVDVPLQLCHFAELFCILYLLTLNRRVFSIVAFWGIIGNLAILVPAFQNHFPHIEIWIFFFGHLGMLATVAYGFFIREIRLQRRDLYTVLVLSALALTLIIPANLWLGANYFYLMQPPPALASLPAWLYWSGLATVYFSLVAGIYLLFREKRHQP
ncbi:MAG: TIGR02206 family membrane protein [Verrucomicrobiales bacterium]|jgi:hypothetical integral membrane protein (TIGR02206 family)|nr:TIGR02206 family membrane protein [Verrucomicrobiales bacterium]